MFPPVGVRLLPETVKAREERFRALRRSVASIRQVRMSRTAGMCVMVVRLASSQSVVRPLETEAPPS
jgi:hypothetical protein